MEKRIITVSELNEYIKMVLEHDELLMRVFVKGEDSRILPIIIKPDTFIFL